MCIQCLLIYLIYTTKKGEREESWFLIRKRFSSALFFLGFFREIMCWTFFISKRRRKMRELWNFMNQFLTFNFMLQRSVWCDHVFKFYDAFIIFTLRWWQQPMTVVTSTYHSSYCIIIEKILDCSSLSLIHLIIFIFDE